MEDATAFGRRTKHEQVDWKDDIQEQYETLAEHKKAPGQIKMGYCPIFKDLIPCKLGKAAHIIPHGIGAVAVETVLKDGRKGDDILWSVENGLWMHNAVEKAMDQARVVLLPVEKDKLDFDKKNYEIKLVVLDERLFGKKNELVYQNGRKKYLWHELNNRILDFGKVTLRPSKRFLYLRYLCTIRQTLVQRPTGLQHQLKALRQETGECWATPGTYLTRGLLNVQSQVILANMQLLCYPSNISYFIGL